MTRDQAAKELVKLVKLTDDELVTRYLKQYNINKDVKDKATALFQAAVHDLVAKYTKQ